MSLHNPQSFSLTQHKASHVAGMTWEIDDRHAQLEHVQVFVGGSLSEPGLQYNRDGKKVTFTDYEVQRGMVSSWHVSTLAVEEV